MSSSRPRDHHDDDVDKQQQQQQQKQKCSYIFHAGLLKIVEESQDLILPVRPRYSSSSYRNDAYFQSRAPVGCIQLYEQKFIVEFVSLNHSFSVLSGGGRF